MFGLSGRCPMETLWEIAAVRVELPFGGGSVVRWRSWEICAVRVELASYGRDVVCVRVFVAD